MNTEKEKRKEKAAVDEEARDGDGSPDRHFMSLHAAMALREIPVLEDEDEDSLHIRSHPLPSSKMSRFA